MACLLARRINEAVFSLPWKSKHYTLICHFILAIYLTSQPVSAKPNSLKEVTDGNWEEILAGEWMIELSVLCYR